MKDPDRIDKEGLEDLISLIPGLKSHKGSFGEHDICTQAGLTRMGPFIYSPLLEMIMSAIQRSGLKIVFDWPAWQDEALRICNEPGELERADLETIRKLLTLHLRKERFCEGHLAAVCEEGLMLRTLQRLKALHDEGEI
jgi:O-acetyl-ADP-ribose deacetylase